MVTLIASIGIAPPAQADGSVLREGVRTGLATGFYAVREGELHPLEASSSRLEIEPVDLPTPSSPAPYLINFSQWTRCFIGNNERDVFANHADYNNGNLRNVTLNCGAGDAIKGWGYKHIRDGHESQWQDKLDQITPFGAMPDASWDDLMTVANDSSTMFPSYTGGSVNTKCTVGQTAFVDNRGVVRQVINSKTVWNRDDGRIITSVPQASQACR
jgi:hypothetical protein